MLLRDFASLNKHNKWTAAFLWLLLLPLTVKLNNVKHEFYLWLCVEEAWSNGFENELFTSIQKRASTRGNLLHDLTAQLLRKSLKIYLPLKIEAKRSKKVIRRKRLSCGQRWNPIWLNFKFVLKLSQKNSSFLH